MRPLRSAVVVELAGGVAGPFCGRLLAELGARVIKIEEPGRGDPSRRVGPFPPTGPDPDCGGLFLYCNAGKESVCLDWRDECGRDAVRRLAASADMLIDDLPPSDAAALGLDDATLRALNPSLVRVSITPFGQTGPYAGWKAEHLTIAHCGGEGYMLPPSIGHPFERYGQRPPTQQGGFLADYTAGLLAACATLAAWAGRDADGSGRHIDLSRWEAELFCNRFALDLWLNRGQPSGRYTIEEPNPTMFRCKDGYLFLTFHREEQFARLADLMGRPEWKTDPRFATASLRRANVPQLHGEILAWLAKRTGEEVFHAMESRGMLAVYFPTAADVARSPQAKHLRLFANVLAPDGRRVSLPRPLYFAPDTDGAPKRAPRLGEHTDIEMRLRRPATTPSRLAKRACPELAQGGPGGEADLPLAGYRILDFTWVAAGPAATQMLASLGADVIKVESTRRLDTARYLNFVPVKDADPDASPDFACINWSKRSVRLDLTRPEALDIVYELVKASDAVVDNMRPGVMDSLALGHEVLRQINPSIVTVSASGFGSSGPLRDYPSIAAVFAGCSGASAITGHPDGPPAIMQLPVDLRAAAAIAFALLAALIERSRTGQGRHIDLASYASIACLIGHTFSELSFTAQNPPRLGNRHPAMAPHGVYRCAGGPSTDSGQADQWVSIAVATDEDWRALARAIGLPRMALDPQYATAQGRLTRQDELDRVIETWTRSRDALQAAQQLQAAGVAAMPSMSNRRIAQNPHLRAREMFFDIQHPKLGRFRLVRPPWRIDGRTPFSRRPAPLMGEHTAEVVQRLVGLPRQDVQALERAGVFV